MRSRIGAVVVVVALGASGLAVVTRSSPDGVSRPDWVAELESAAGAPAVESTVDYPVVETVPIARSVAVPPATYAFPEPGRWDVLLDRARSADNRVVRLAARDDSAAGTTVRVEVLDRGAATKVGASGFVFTVSGPGRLPVELSVDYAGFAQAYGASYADRIRLASLPACAGSGACPATATVLPARNDRTAQTLTVDVDLAEANTFAVTAAVGGDEGTFAATPLAMTGSWQVAPGSGEFGYSYPIDVPAPGGGSAPSVGLGYSSGAIDGLTIGTNTQAGPNGLGWSDFANAFIERRYEPCIAIVKTTDLCWLSDNATISLAGISGVLVPANAEHTEWRVHSDPGWRVERLTGAPYTDIYQQQYWKVTGPDGTQYFFGFGHMPGRQSNAILGVHVLADHRGEPCRAAGDTLGACQQGWRWYLDRVVDPDGNVTSYVYERQTNWYAGALGIAGHVGNTRYHPAAMLTHIYYGGRGWSADQYSGHVEIGVEWRCDDLAVTCPAATAGRGGFPDVPTDLVCAHNAACTVYAPAFFNARRYSYVRTQVKIGAAWKGVAQFNLIHSFNPNSIGVAKKLQLEKVQHAVIAFDKLNTYPNTVFGYGWKDNRVDHAGNIPKAMRHNRLTKVTNPFGGITTVTYDTNRKCERDYALTPPPHWDRNLRDCFPQAVKDGSFLRTGVFNKYLVTRVVESPGQGSPDMTTSYQYEGDPAWAFDTGAFARDEDEFGWSTWRGYGTVVITRGLSVSRLRVFRGWDQDLTLAQDAGGDWVPLGPRRSVPVWTLDGDVSYVDHPALAGRVLEERRYLGSGSPAESRRHTYEKRVTVDPGPSFLVKAEWVGASTSTERVYNGPGAFRERRSTTTYNTNREPATTLEEGWLDTTGDERCTVTTYANNPAANMVGYPAVNTMVAGSCAGTQVLSRTETYYDGGTTLGAAPVKGNPTRQRTLVESGRWSETTTEYDEFGRPVRMVDPTGAATTTAYGVTSGAWAGQSPTRTTVTNALGHQTITDYHPEFAVPSRLRDANGNVTDYWYDEFGRLIAVWLPTEPLAFAEPSYKYTYDIANRAIRSQRLTSESRCCETAVFEDTWVIYDGFWRERQTQSPSPVAGRTIVSETTYDDSGQVRDEIVEQALTGTRGRYINGGTAWLNWTRHAYDELGREIRTSWYRAGTSAHASTTSYGADIVTATGPDGRQARQRIDGLGRTVSTEESDGQAWVATTYGYDLADRLLSVTDPAGNRADYTVNLAGWRTTQRDPDRGTATFSYDNSGRPTEAVDARGNRIVTVHDALGRPVERRSGSATGSLLASWQYDTAAGGKGKLHRETTHTSVGAWVSETLGYDVKGRPTGSRLVVPAGLPGLSGTYQITQGYDRADRVRTMDLPAIGGLPAERLTADYNTLGLATRMAGIDEYVWGAAYDDRGRRQSLGLGPRPGGTTWMGRNWSYDPDQRLSGVETFINGTGVVSDHEYAYDPAGNLTEKLTKLGGPAWRECFGYDRRSRLTSAHTVLATASCASGTPNTGDRPYVHAYEYSSDSRMTTRTENGTRTAYGYPAPGGARPHAPTSIGTGTYTWDANGNLSSRTVAGRTDTFVWSVDNRLASVGATTFVYDASGQRLLRRTPDGRSTLYVAGHEITVNTGGTVLSAVRPYTFDGVLVATRSLTGVDYLVSDGAGSVEMSAPAGGSPSATRAYLPYGGARGATGSFASERGFVGQIEDRSTGLSYLNARYYDAGAGVFISADPVQGSSTPYGYSRNNPTTFADPNGAYSVYTWGLERENSLLREQNKQLMAHIGKLNNHIEYLQGVIRKQQSDIKKLLTYIGALEAQIARQASYIRYLAGRVYQLQRKVWAQAREISSLRGQVGYYKGIVNTLAGRLWAGTGKLRWVVESIHSFRGIPYGAFIYDQISVLGTKLAASERQRRGLEEGIAIMEGGIDSFVSGQTAQREYITSLEEDVATLAEFVNSEAGVFGPIWDGEKLTTDRPGGGGRFSGLGDALKVIAANGLACITGAGGGAAGTVSVVKVGAAVTTVSGGAVALGGCVAGVTIYQAVKANS